MNALAVEPMGATGEAPEKRLKASHKAEATPSDAMMVAPGVAWYRPCAEQE